VDLVAAQPVAVARAGWVGPVQELRFERRRRGRRGLQEER
jgi:hypothetical protein